MTLLSKNDVAKSRQWKKGDVLIVRPEFFSDENRDAKYQLFQVTGGKGLCPIFQSVAIEGWFWADGEFARLHIYDFLGIASKKTKNQWKKEFGEPQK